MCDFDVVVGGFVACVGDDAVDVASGAAVDVVLAGHEPCVTREILFVVWAFQRHFSFSYN